MWNCVIPIGRQRASGLSLLLAASRCFLSSAAHGVYGRPPDMLAPSSKNVATGGEFGSTGGGAAPRPRAPPPSPRNRTQLPDRSGLPLAMRGTGASMRTWPLSSRGTPGAGYFGHCAASDTEPASIRVRRPTSVRVILLLRVAVYRVR